MTLSLFGSADTDQVWREDLAPGARVLRGLALADAAEICEAIAVITAPAPYRHMHTPGGHCLSVAMANCGKYGWVADAMDYRYDRTDPLTNSAWPAMPIAFVRLANAAAGRAGFAGFSPDACVINRYEVGARMSLHQDKNEHDFGAPIVSVSLGLPAIFLFGGLARTDKCLRVQLAHGDVVVWGGAPRLRYHCVLPLKAGVHPQLGAQRINLTFRKAR